MKVIKGHQVRVHYKGILEDGTEFDNSFVRGTTLDFEAGSQKLIRGFSEGVYGMQVGETRSIQIPVELAYGPHNPDAIQTVPKSAFAEDFNFIVGGTVQGNGPRGPFLAKIKAEEEDSVVMDMNHPLAGHDLEFEVELVSIENPEFQPEEAPTTEDVPMANWNASMKKAELLEVAKSQGLSVTTRSTKAQIIEALSA
jgi:FKBP-type peptidyl-prolyl cis-trans isomerase 2